MRGYFRVSFYWAEAEDGGGTVPFLNGAFDPVPALHAGDQQQVPRCNALDGGSAKPCPARSTSIGPARAESSISPVKTACATKPAIAPGNATGCRPCRYPCRSLPETTIVEEIGVVQFAGCHSGVEQVQSPTDLSLFSRRQGVCMPITANALYRDSFNFYATNWPAS